MAKTQIQWTDETWNTITGCTPVSPGCSNCYARKHTSRLRFNPNENIRFKYRNGFDLTIHPQYLNEPLNWIKPRLVFVNSMSDTFHEDVPQAFIEALFDRMVRSGDHIFQVLTKRAERLAELSQVLPWPDNVWAGVTVENENYLDRLDLLKQVPSRVRFVSFEPLLGPVPNADFSDIHWVIVGGESGAKARPMNLDWARGIRDQCMALGVPFFFKQVGGRHRNKGGRLLDDIEWNEFPNALNRN
ncbi:MAG: DUF5131 family protein [Desulfomonilaceae bacterium]